MELTSEQLTDIMTAMESLCRPAGDAELRQSARVKREGIVTILVNETGGDYQAVAVELKDYCKGGVGFVHWQQLAVGQRFLLQLPLLGGQEINIDCTVVNCQALDDGSWRIGAEFALGAGDQLWW